MTLRLSSGAEVVGDDGGDRAAEEDGVAVARAPARSAPSQPARPSSMTSGVRVRLTRVATRSPTARPSGDSGPTSSTVPTSMPPEPVSGFCILPRVATMSSTARRTASPSSWVRSSWRNDAASRLSRSTRMRTSSGHSSRRVSRRWAACGRTTCVVEDPVEPRGVAGGCRLGEGRRGRHDRLFLRCLRHETGNLAARHWTHRRISAYSGRGVARHTTDAPLPPAPPDRHLVGPPRTRSTRP